MANIEEMKQEAADAKMREKAGKAYDKSLTTTETAPVVKKAKGGTASSRADGIASKGKTRGTIVMCGGGMYKK
jgi:hypothetical protein